jgi:hypothetical protein
MTKFIYLPAYKDWTECSETSAYTIQTQGNYPEENMQHTEHGESLKSRIKQPYYTHNNLKITVRFYLPIYFIVWTLFYLFLYFSPFLLFPIFLFPHYPSFRPFNFFFYYVALGNRRHWAAGTGPDTCRSCYNVPMSPGSTAVFSLWFRSLRESEIATTPRRSRLPSQPARPGGKLARAPFTNSPSPQPVERFLSPSVTSIRFITS